MVEVDYRKTFGDKVELLFGRFEAVVGQVIGYQGSIIGEIRQRRLHQDGEPCGSVNLEGLDPILARYTDSTGFRFDATFGDGGPSLGYQIDCRIGLVPEIVLPTIDGGSLRMHVLTGYSGNDFFKATVTRCFNNRKEFVRARELETFDGNYSGGKHHLIISQRTARGNEIHVAYDLTEEGNPGDIAVSIGSMIHTNQRNLIGVVERGGIRWFYQNTKPDRSIWNQFNNQVVIGFGDEVFSFPIRTNMSMEMVNISEGIMSSPGHLIEPRGKTPPLLNSG